MIKANIEDIALLRGKQQHQYVWYHMMFIDLPTIQHDVNVQAMNNVKAILDEFDDDAYYHIELEDDGLIFLYIEDTLEGTLDIEQLKVFLTMAYNAEYNGRFERTTRLYTRDDKVYPI